MGPKLAELLYDIDDKQATNVKDQTGMNNEGGTLRRARSTRVQAFAGAFTQGVINSGGPEGRNEAAMLVHGHDLAGSTELAPGTRIYQVISHPLEIGSNLLH